MVDTPDDYVNEIIEDFAFEGHPLGKSVIGNKKTISSITKKDIDQFYKLNYRYSNMLVSMTGNFPNKYKEILEKMFIKSEVKKNKLIKPTIEIYPFNKTIKKSQVKYVRRKLEQNLLSILFPIGGIYDPKLNHYRMLENILGGNMSSRLFVRIREELGLAYGISCSKSIYEEAGYFEISTKTEPNNTLKCLKNILIELQKITTKKISNKELEDNKKNYSDIFKTGFDYLENVAEFYSEQYFFNSEKESMDDRIKNIKKINSQELKDCAVELFDFKKMMVICYGECQEKKLLNIIEPFI